MSTVCLLYVYCMSTVFCVPLSEVLHSQFFTATWSRFCTAAGQTLQLFAHELTSLEGHVPMQLHGGQDAAKSPLWSETSKAIPVDKMNTDAGQ